MKSGTAETVEALVTSLEETFGEHVEVWARQESGDYVSVSMPERQKTASVEIAQQCEVARIGNVPVAKQLDQGGYLLVTPLCGLDGREWFATTCLETNSPQLALNLAVVVSREQERHREVQQLREENGAFLQQLREDMEELVFLRSMAERLALGGLSLRSEDLLRYVLPQLGEAAGVEEAHFIDARLGDDPRVTESWIAPSCRAPANQEVIERLVALFRDATVDRPTVKNYFQQTDEGHDYPDIREFALVSVSTSLATLGWLLVLNRHKVGAGVHHHPVWSLSNDELGTCEVSLVSTTAAMLASHTHNLSLFEERESFLVSVVRTLVSAIESRDPYTCGHSERVARFGKRLARELGYDEESCERLYLTGLLHDIGKIGLSDSVLKKTGPLTSEEFAEIKNHPDLGWAILRELEPMDYVLPGVLHHHERYDGDGYPDGLIGADTPLDGRLLAVVDAFDAMTSDRPYRKGMPPEKAVEILQQGAGTQWDAEVVDAFLAILPDILQIRDSYRRPPLPLRKPQVAASMPPLLAMSEPIDLPELLPTS